MVPLTPSVLDSAAAYGRSREQEHKEQAHLPPAPPPKSIDPDNSKFELNNLEINVIDNTSGLSLKNMLKTLLGWLGVKGDDFTVIPQGTHAALTTGLDGLFVQLSTLADAVEESFDS